MESHRIAFPIVVNVVRPSEAVAVLPATILGAAQGAEYLIGKKLEKNLRKKEVFIKQTKRTKPNASIMQPP